MAKGFHGQGAWVFLFVALLSTQVAFAATKNHRVAWDTEPSTQAVIAFSPDVTSTSPSIEYGSGTDVSSWSTLSALDQHTFAGSLVSYSGRLTGLAADSAVYFRVCDQDGCGQRFWFKTAPGAGNNTPFVVVAGGDTRTGLTNRRQGNELIAKIRPLFVMHGGDYTNANSAAEMEQLLADWTLAYSDDSIDGNAYKRIYPLVLTHGNHENNEYNTLCKVFGVDYNQNGSCEVVDTYDTYGATNVSSLLRVYTLNSEFRDWGTSHFSDMNSWLSADLSANGSAATWRFAQYHKPMFPHFTGKSENPDLFAAWSGNFYNHAMNLVVESDTHMMKLTESLEPSGSTFVDQVDGSNTGGTVYVGEGSWGAPARSADDAKSWTIDLASIQQLKVIAVHPDRLEVRTALFDDTASTLTREERAADPTRLSRSVNWWDVPGVGEVLDLKRHVTTERSVIDEIAGFSGNCEHVLCEFTDISIPGGSSIENWSWDFGDGSHASVQHPDHGYDDDGLYNVTLRVTDEASDIHVFGKSVTVARAGNRIEDISVGTGNDDVEERLSSNAMYMTSSDLEMVADGGSGDQAIGLRFDNIGATNGATVNSAYIRFTAKDSGSAGADLEVRAQNAGNADTFTTASNNLSGRSMTGAVAWDNIPAWSDGFWYSTSDLASIVQQVVNRGDWTTGNSMVFMVTGSQGDHRRAYSYNDSAANAPVLNINYGVGTDLSIPIATGDDDMEEREGGGISLTSTDLEMVIDIGRYDNQKIGLRFNGITVPQGETINTASISFKAEGSVSYGADLAIVAENVDDAAAFADLTGDLTSRTPWTSAIDWDNLPNWSGGSTYDSPDLSSVVQTVFDRPGWSPGNSMVFKVTGASGDLRRAWTYDGNSSAAPQLHVEYSDVVTPCTASHFVPAGDWVAFALPCDPGGAVTVGDVLTVHAGLAAAEINTRWVVYRFDPSAQFYYRMGLTERMYPGRGYWVKTLDETTVSFTGVSNMTGDLELETDAVDGVWNFVGFTGNSEKAWTDFKAYNGTVLVAIPAADAWNDPGETVTECGLTPPSDECLVYRRGYVWNGSNYDPFDALLPDFDDKVQPGHAMWVKAYKPGTLLRIEPPAGAGAAMTSEAAPVLMSGSVSKPLKDKTPKPPSVDNGQWSIRLVAESGTMRDRSNVLGQRPNSVDGLDSNDVEELTPFGSKYLSLTFENEGFDTVDWGYTSDYRATTKKPSGEWLFRVRASSDAQEITLRWDGEEKLLRSATLRNEQSGEMIHIRPGESYHFLNAGGDNWFSWIMKGKK